MEDSMEIPQKINRINYYMTKQSSPGCLPENLKTFIHKNICPFMFTATLFTVAQT